MTRLKIKIKFIAFLFQGFIWVNSYAQIKTTKLDPGSLPENINYTGKVIHAVKWSDNLGQNIVITTETGAFHSKTANQNEYRDAALYAYHYVLKGDSTTLLWKVYDYNKECPLDLDLHFIDKTFAVTDIDKNGVAETWLMYKNGCYSDVSPVPTKIIMYEGTKKYVLRGESKVQVSETEFMGGNATLDYNFKNGNILFRQYAEKLWKQHQVEKWSK